MDFGILIEKSLYSEVGQKLRLTSRLSEVQLGCDKRRGTPRLIIRLGCVAVGVEFGRGGNFAWQNSEAVPPNRLVAVKYSASLRAIVSIKTVCYRIRFFKELQQ